MSVAEAAHPQVPPQPRVIRDAAMDWVKFDAELARDGAVDPVDKALYAALASFIPASSGQQRATEADGFDAPTRRVLAACIGRSVDTVDRATKRLEERGLIAVERRRDPDNPRSNLPSVYRLLDHERWDERAAERVESRRKARQKPLAASVRPPSPQPCGEVAASVRPGGGRSHAAVLLPSEKSSLEKFSLSEEPGERPERETPAGSEREIFAPPNNKPTTPTTPPADAADRIITAYTTILGRPLLTRTRTTLHSQAAEALTAGYPEEWLTDRARELAVHGWTDLTKHIEKSTAPLPGAEPTAAAGSGLPPWCGECGNGMPARLNIRFRRRQDGTLCHCHPNAARQPLPGTDTTVSGWLALASQDRPSTTDLRVQGALTLGRQMQAEHNATRNGWQPYREPTAEERAADLGYF